MIDHLVEQFKDAHVDNAMHGGFSTAARLHDARNAMQRHRDYDQRKEHAAVFAAEAEVALRKRLFRVSTQSSI